MIGFLCVIVCIVLNVGERISGSLKPCTNSWGVQKSRILTSSPGVDGLPKTSFKKLVVVPKPVLEVVAQKRRSALRLENIICGFALQSWQPFTLCPSTLNTCQDDKGCRFLEVFRSLGWKESD
eukprot:5052112-Amphidinium_carterae.1